MLAINSLGFETFDTFSSYRQLTTLSFGRMLVQPDLGPSDRMSLYPCQLAPGRRTHSAYPLCLIDKGGCGPCYLLLVNRGLERPAEFLNRICLSSRIHGLQWKQMLLLTMGVGLVPLETF